MQDAQILSVSANCLLVLFVAFTFVCYRCFIFIVLWFAIQLLSANQLAGVGYLCE